MAQRMKESSIADPPPLLDQFLLQDGDVRCRTAEADPSQLEPEPQRFPKRGTLYGRDWITAWYLGVGKRGCFFGI